MAVNKVIYNGTTLIDTTTSTVTPGTLAAGTTALDSTGTLITGTAKSVSSWGDLANNGYLWNSLLGGDTT